jgi:hypothetical protein
MRARYRPLSPALQSPRGVIHQPEPGSDREAVPKLR